MLTNNILSTICLGVRSINSFGHQIVSHQLLFPIAIFIPVLIQFLFHYSEATIVNGKCGFPGKPYNSKVDLDLKLHYFEGEEVQYQCMDYWNYIQVRQCRKGHWSGPPARCADFQNYIWLRDVKIEDITNPLQPHNIINVRNITLDTGSWKFPNAFTNTRSKQKFILHDNRLYRWRLRFNDTFDKLFVRFNFNTINYTQLSAKQKDSYYMNASLDVGSHRQCILEMQTFDIWKTHGQKIDNFFVCDTKSSDVDGPTSDFALDPKGPSNRMTLYTKSSLNISYELIAVFLGKAYGTEHEPLCGEPEYDISHFSRFNQQFRDYSFECKKVDWIYQQFEDNKTKLADTGIHFKRCMPDMKWFGSYPTCKPKSPCSIDGLLMEPGSKFLDDKMMIVSLDGLYFVNDTFYYAIDGTIATYGCANSTTDMLTGKETRTCFRNGTWGGSKPTCHNPNQAKLSPLLIIIVGSSLLILLVIIVLFVTITKRFKQKIMKSIENQQNQTIAVKELMDLYQYEPERNSELYENYNEIDDRYSKSVDDPSQYVAIEYKSGKNPNSAEYVSPASIAYSGRKEFVINHTSTEDDQYLTMQAERTVLPNPAPRLTGIRAKSGDATTASAAAFKSKSKYEDKSAIYINYK